MLACLMAEQSLAPSPVMHTWNYWFWYSSTTWLWITLHFKYLLFKKAASAQKLCTWSWTSWSLARSDLKTWTVSPSSGLFFARDSQTCTCTSVTSAKHRRNSPSLRRQSAPSKFLETTPVHRRLFGSYSESRFSATQTKICTLPPQAWSKSPSKSPHCSKI